MLTRVLRGAIIGLLAAFGAAGIGFGGATTIVAFAVPVLVSVVDVFVGEVFSLCVLFGLGCLMWAYTPLGSAVRDILPSPPKTEVSKEGVREYQRASEQTEVRSATIAPSKY